MGRRTVKSLAAGAVACVCALAMAATASALDDCATQPAPDLVHSESGRFESVAFDGKGRLFFTNSEAGKLLMIRHSGAKPKLVLDDIDAPGGIVFRRNGHVLVGYGDSIAQGSDGEANPEAGLIDVNPRTGSSRIYVDGLQMANGVTRGPGGQIFASTDFGTGVDRVLDGAVELAWAPLDSSNGMVVDRGKKYLFVNQTFTPSPTIARIPLDDPTAAVAWFTAPDEPGAFLDGLDPRRRRQPLRRRQRVRRRLEGQRPHRGLHPLARPAVPERSQRRRLRPRQGPVPEGKPVRDDLRRRAAAAPPRPLSARPRRIRSSGPDVGRPGTGRR